ncbi:conserved hypothetical protein [Vibrio nigripulchritudo SOn1]|uniref:Uncharacterized protein n=1 Tax=Vibrio nigripulchritudo SOn1 TaxID=1238450 RepID=A0AAV2VQD3_9VIBR|nr:hypothetical protein [Vibrio nigripulchritudo]CCO46619.1 conserved hypothetical protein [Vibrio nigripulchritudo SOn1]
MSTPKKIFCVTLLGREQVQATAVFDHNQLVITKLEEIKGTFGRWKRKLKRDLKKKHDEGYHMVVEERGDDFSEFAHKVLLEEADPTEKRGYMNIAFDHYFNLLQLGDASNSCIVLNRGLERHWIRESSVNIMPDDRGRRRYDIDHSKFSSYQRAILLCVLTACEFNQVNEDYVATFLDEINVEEDDPAFSTLRRITIERDMEGV